MRTRGGHSLAILLLCVGGSAVADDITIYRCQDDAGRVTLQDERCPDGHEESARSMVRPQDPPPAPPPRESTAPDATSDDAPPMDDVPPPADAPPFAAWPPPPMFRCTDYDGAVRFSEDYAPSDRCVPLAVLGYRVGDYSDAAATCRWVQESCLRIDDASACDQFRAKLKQARSDALHAFSDTAAYRKSEAERLARIVAESCR